MVDTTAKLADGTKLAGPQDIKQYLLRHPEMFTSCLTTKLLEYGTGRELSVGDRRIVRQIVEQEPEDGYGMRDLVLQIVESEAFQTK